MSSLLDVLHKRSPRWQAEDSLTIHDNDSSAPAATEEAVRPQELTLATEPKTSPDPALTGEEFPAGTLSSDTATALPADVTVLQRRRSDSGPAMTPAVRSRSWLRQSMLAGLLASVVLATVFVGLQFRSLPSESFLAEPGMPVPQPPAADVTAQGAAIPEQSSPLAPTTSPVKTPAAVATVPHSKPREMPWYDQPALPAAQEEPQPAALIRITHGSRENPELVKLREGYAALRIGDAARAEASYREVLALDPRSVDAMLGLGVVATRGGRVEEARALYLQVQSFDPKNAVAAAALSALPGGTDQAGAESRLKNMLREQPDSAPLHFALGVHYAGEQRWSDAQAAFFDAVRHEPTNADYAFNLAVSLDRLGQTQAAASYYQRAIELAAGAEQFDPQLARQRLASLRGDRG